TRELVAIGSRHHADNGGTGIQGRERRQRRSCRKDPHHGKECIMATIQNYLNGECYLEDLPPEQRQEAFSALMQDEMNRQYWEDQERANAVQQAWQQQNRAIEQVGQAQKQLRAKMEQAAKDKPTTTETYKRAMRLNALDRNWD